MFQSQTRRLPPRNVGKLYPPMPARVFQSQTRRLPPRNAGFPHPFPCRTPCFNRRRDACLPATFQTTHISNVSQVSFNRRRDACLPATWTIPPYAAPLSVVSIPAATLASPQPYDRLHGLPDLGRFNRRRDACLPATQSRLARGCWHKVSIADATLASPQHQ